MTTGLLLQYVVIGAVVLASAMVALRKLAPQLTSRWLAAAAMRLDRPGHAAWRRALGRRLQPKQAAGHCGDGCSTCNACGPKPPAVARGEAMPLEFRSRVK